MIRTALIASALAGLGWHLARPTPSDARFQPSVNGADSRLGLGARPVAVRDGPSGEVVEVEVTLTNRFPGRARTRFATVWTTDTGEVVGRGGVSPISELAREGVTAQLVSSPDGLPDGYCQLRVLAAAATDHDEVTAEVPLWFRVTDGLVSQIEADEWYGSSNANRGVLQ